MSEEKTEATITVPPATPPARKEVRVCGVPFYTDIGDDIFAWKMMTLEAATHGMNRDLFQAWVRRHRITLNMWNDATGNQQSQLCDGVNVLGDWID